MAFDPLLWEQHPEKTRYQEPVFRRFFDESLASGGALLATDVRTGDVIGSSRFHGHDPEKREVEIGWTFLARSHWGGRYSGDSDSRRGAALRTTAQELPSTVSRSASSRRRSRKPVL